jgi:hypothetical protein
VFSQDAAGLAKGWDWQAEKQVFAFGSSSNPAGWIKLDPSGEQLAAVLGTNGVWVWTTTNWQRLFILRPQGGEVTALAYSPDGQRLVMGGVEGAVDIWDSTTGQQLNRLKTTNQSIRRVAVSPDGQRLVAVAERAAWVWDLQSGRRIRTFPDDSVRPTNQIAAVFADDTGDHFATIDPEGRLTLWREGRAPQHLMRSGTSKGRPGESWIDRGVSVSCRSRSVPTAAPSPALLWTSVCTVGRRFPGGKKIMPGAKRRGQRTLQEVGADVRRLYLELKKADKSEPRHLGCCQSRRCPVNGCQEWSGGMPGVTGASGWKRS